MVRGASHADNNSLNGFNYFSSYNEGTLSGTAGGEGLASQSEKLDAYSEMQKLAFQRIQEAEHHAAALQASLVRLAAEAHARLEAEKQRTTQITQQFTAQLASQAATIMQEKAQRVAAEKRAVESEEQFNRLQKEHIAFSQAAQAAFTKQQQQFAAFRNMCIQQLDSAQKQIQFLSGELNKERAAKEEAVQKANSGEVALQRIQSEAIEQIGKAENDTKKLELELERMKSEVIQKNSQLQTLQKNVQDMEIEHETQLEKSNLERAHSKELAKKMASQLNAIQQAAQKQLAFDAAQRHQYELSIERASQDKVMLEQRARELDETTKKQIELDAAKIREFESAAQKANAEKEMLRQKALFLESQLPRLFNEASKRIQGADFEIRNLRATLLNEHQTNQMNAVYLSNMQNQMAQMGQKACERLNQLASQYKFAEHNLAEAAASNARSEERIKTLTQELAALRAQKEREVVSVQNSYKAQNKETETLSTTLRQREQEIEMIRAELGKKASLIDQQKSHFEKALSQMQQSSCQKMHDMEQDFHSIQQKGQEEARARKMAEEKIAHLEASMRSVGSATNTRLAQARSRAAKLEAEIKRLQVCTHEAKRQAQNEKNSFHASLNAQSLAMADAKTDLSALAQKFAHYQKESSEKIRSLEQKVQKLSAQLLKQQNENFEAHKRCLAAEQQLEQCQREASKKLELANEERFVLQKRLAGEQIDRAVLGMRKEALGKLYQETQSKIYSGESELQRMSYQAECQKKQHLILEQQIHELEHEKTGQQKKLAAAHKNTDNLLKAIDSDVVMSERLRKK